MTDLDAIEQPPRKKSWIMLILKILFVLAAMLLIGVTIMANMGGKSETLKRSIESFISETTPYDARIGRLNNMTFFPNISFDFEDTEFFPKGGVDAVISLSSVQITLGFWDVMLSTGKIKQFEIKNLRALSNAVLNTPLVIDSAMIVDSDSGPRFELKGSANGKPVLLVSSMKAQGVGKNRKYSFDEERDLDFHIADIEAKAKMISKGEGVTFNNLSITNKDKPVIDGNLQLKHLRGRAMISGQLNMDEHRTDLTPDIEIDRVEHKTTGTFKSGEFHLDDFTEGSQYDAVMDTVDNMFGEYDMPGGLDLILDAASVFKNGMAQGAYNGKLPLKDWRIDASMITPKAP